MEDLFEIFFTSPEFEDKRKTRLARYLGSILNIGFFIFVLLIISRQYLLVVNIVFGILAIATLGMHILIRQGQIRLATAAFSLFTWGSMTYLAWVGDGMRDFAIITYFIMIFLASLLGSPRLSIALSALSIASIWSLYYAQITGVFTPVQDSLLANALSITSIFLIFASILYFTISDLENALTQSLNNEIELTKQNDELLLLQEELEEKSKNLEASSEQTRVQARRLQVIADVVQQITQTQNTEVLLPEITKLTSENFGFYHVGVFLLSDDQKYMQLKAANSTGGQKLVEESYQIEIGSASTVGQVARDEKPRISLMGTENSIPVNQPYLTETRSEMAIPLIYGTQLLGILDVQSKKDAAFDEREIEIFSTLANQISIAIENARQFERAQKALEEMEDLSRRYVRQEWKRIQKRKNELGYRYLHGNVEKIDESNPSLKEEKGTQLNIPVRIRDEMIGILQVRLDESAPAWQAEDKELVETIANRVALALENARLLEDTAQRAGKESALSNFAATISNISQTDKLMSVAVSELQKILDASEVSFELTDL
jgi:GAF domain-containing protein